MGKEIEPEILKDLIILHGLTPHRVALNLGIEPSNFSRFLKNKPGVLSAQKLAGVVDYIGLTESGRLKPGIHRWSSPSRLPADQDRIEGTVRTLVPGGATAVRLRPDTLMGRGPRDFFVLIPHWRPDVRIVLSIHPQTPRGLPSSSRELRPEGLGVGSTRWGGEIGGTDPNGSFLSLPGPVVDRILADERLAVEDLDGMLGLSISGDRGWTWERVAAGLEAKGIPPEEVARKMGLR